DADRVLCDRASHRAVLDGLDLLLAGVEADDHHVAYPAGLPDRVDHTDRGALVRAEETVEVRIAFKDRRGEVRRLEVVAGAVLDVDDLDVGSVFLDVLDEAIAPVDAGDARLIVDDGR